MSNLIVADISVRQDNEGRYCLNDLHKAAGGLKTHQLSNWLRNDQTQELVAELRNSDSSSINPPVNRVTGKGKEQGTFVVKELVYAYEMWISPKFHLKVIRAYDTLQNQGIAVADHAAADLMANPFAYFERLLEQAKKIEAAKQIAECERDVVVKTIAKSDRTLQAVCRRLLPHLNLNKTKQDLMNLGFFYRHTDGNYHVHRKYSNLFSERFIESKGWNAIFPTEDGIRLLVLLYVQRKLTLKKGFTPDNSILV